MTTTKTKKWTDELVASLEAEASKVTPVPGDSVRNLASTLGFSERSVASKLRQLGHNVESMAKVTAPTFNEAQASALQALVEANPNNMTYAQIAEAFEGGAFSAKQVQGKLLAMELTSLVKATEKVEVARQYTDEEQAKFISLVNAGRFIEEIAEALGRSLPSIRGKALSLHRSKDISAIPKQKESHAKTLGDPIDELGTKIATMTVAEIASAMDKTERGVKTLLTRRGITVADYNGASKKEKADSKRSATVAA